MGFLTGLADSPLGIALAVTFLLVIGAHDAIPRADADSEWYIALAQGRIATVIAPFSHRFLHPLVARALALLLSHNFASAFAVIAYGSCFTLLYSVSSVVKRAGTRPLLCLPFLLSPLFVSGVLDAYLPDIFHAALLGVFFCLYATENRRTAWPFLLMAMLTRENTLFLCLVIVVLELLWGRRRMTVSAAATGVAGAAICAVVGSRGQPNIHALSSLAYLALKVPYNFLKNWLGIVLWTDTFSWKCATAFSVKIPRWLPSGHIREIGLAPWDPKLPLNTILTLLTEFGLGITVALKALTRHCRAALHEVPQTVSLSYWYGLLAVALGTLTGAGTARLVGYGWPAVWIAVPVLLTKDCPLRPPSLARLILAHLALCWMPAVFAYYFDADPLYTLPQIGIALCVHAYAWNSLTARVAPHKEPALEVGHA
jgi:hypothetical protein